MARCGADTFMVRMSVSMDWWTKVECKRRPLVCYVDSTGRTRVLFSFVPFWSQRRRRSVPHRLAQLRRGRADVKVGVRHEDAAGAVQCSSNQKRSL